MIHKTCYLHLFVDMYILSIFIYLCVYVYLYICVVMCAIFESTYDSSMIIIKRTLRGSISWMPFGFMHETISVWGLMVE